MITTIIIWIYVISLVIKEYDIIKRFKQEYYYWLYKRYIRGNFFIEIYSYLWIVIKGTLYLPLYAVLVLADV